MQDRGISLIFSIIALLALIAGGVFVYNYWQTTVYIRPQPVEKQELVIEKAKEEGIKEIIETEPKNNLVAEELAEKAQEIIKESEEVIAKIQDFIEKEKEKMALIKIAMEKSKQIKGVYMNEFIANSQAPTALDTQQNIKNLLDETELNGVVIDVKEAYGPNLPDSLRKLINELHQKDVWVIARICAFRDSSLTEENPNLYLKTISNSTTSSTTTTEEFWQDFGERHWLDPKSPEVQDYLIEFSKEVIDFGFDELQFDYVRFPSDGDTENIIYPFYDGVEEKYEVIREFFLNLSNALKDYKSSIILSVDLFGYVANQYQASDIGQRLIDVADTFDYVSFMLYPSHFYGGFKVNEDLKRGLPAVYFPYIDEDIDQVVSNHPYEVIARSIFSAYDYLSLFDSEVEIRPWLQDFNLNFDMSREIYYDAEKIQAQIKGTQDSGAAGWLLWNSANIYTEEALEKP